MNRREFVRSAALAGGAAVAWQWNTVTFLADSATDRLRSSSFGESAGALAKAEGAALHDASRSIGKMSNHRIGRLGADRRFELGTAGPTNPGDRSEGRQQLLAPARPDSGHIVER